MSLILPTFSRFTDFYSNSLIPENAILLRKLFALNGKLSQQKGWKYSFSSIVIPRIFTGFLTVPVALLESARISIQGINISAKELLGGNYGQAGRSLLKNSQNALQCLILTVTNLAYAALGFLFGACIFTKFIPRPLPLTSEETLKEENKNLIKELEEKNSTISTMERLVKSQEQTFDKGWDAMRRLYAEKMSFLEETYIARNLLLEQLYKQKEAELERTYLHKTRDLQELYNTLTQNLEGDYNSKLTELETTYNNVMIEIVSRGLECISKNEILQTQKQKEKAVNTTPSTPVTPRALSRTASPYSSSSRPHSNTTSTSSPYSGPKDPISN